MFADKHVDIAWTQTYTGIAFPLLEPEAEDVSMQDIAHSLSLQCRYGGHVDRFYSVAEHCVFMSNQVSEEAAPYALMHDAAEAYISDFPSPIKNQVVGYREIEDNIMRVILEAFSLALPTEEMEREVHVADGRMLLTERRDFMKEPPRPWGVEDKFEPFKEKLNGWNPVVAKQEFLRRADGLGIEYR